MDISFHRKHSPQDLSHPFQRITSKVRNISVVFGLCLLLAACGPAKESADPTDLTTATQQIAQNYAATGDLAKAQGELAALSVANPNQWLIFVAETTASDPSAQAAMVESLIKLAEDSGLRSPIFAQYATTHGLTGVVSAAGAQNSAVQVASLVQQPQANTLTTAGSAPAPTADNSSSVATATDAPETTATPEPTATVVPPAQVLATTIVNLRVGPGTEYDLAGSLQSGESATILEKTQDAGWWKVQLSNGVLGWVFSEIVETNGALDAVAVAVDIPPTPTAAPVAVAQATVAPVEATPPPAEPTAAPQQNSGAPYFSIVQRRLVPKAENGDCVGRHLLRITVLDANGNPLNGVTLKGIYTGAVYRTGDQGKGDGIMEFDLYGSGEGFTVTNDTNGAEAGSDRAEGFTTQSRSIDKPTLIGAGYCSDDATCQVFYDSWGCNGHHSWETTFKRNY